MQQLDLLSTPPRAPRMLPYAPQSLPSKQGAISAAPRAPGQYERVLEALKRAGNYGATASELKRATGITQSSTMSARINRLVRDGKVRDSLTTRPGDCGIEVTIWIAI